MGRSGLDEKLSFKMPRLSFSFKLDWVYKWSVAKIASKEIRAFNRSMKFFSSEVLIYLYKSTIKRCTECYFHVWAGALKCY